MSTNAIKTRILLPRGTVDALSTREFITGELVLINSGGKFKPVEITSPGTGLAGASAAEYAELELSALQIKLSGDVSLQSAWDTLAATVASLSTYAEIRGQLSSDGYALVGADTDLSSGNTVYAAKAYAKAYAESEAADAESEAKSYADGKIEALDYSDAAEPTKFVTAVSEADGVISVSRAQPTIADVSGLDARLSTFALSADVYGKSETSSSAEIAVALADVTGSLTAYVEKSALSISYDSTAKKIYLSGGTNVSEIDATDFIKDGMLSAASYDPATKKLILTFNTDAEAEAISVDIGDLVDTYTAEDTSTIDMEVSSNVFTASIKASSITPDLLSADAGWIFDCND